MASMSEKRTLFLLLDIGEGKEVNLVERCPRSTLQQQCIKYLGLMERLAYEVVVEDGKFFYKQSGKLLDTTAEAKDAKWIFVLSTSMTLYVGKKKCTFQHSGFLAGGATSVAGKLVIEDGILKVILTRSRPIIPIIHTMDPQSSSRSSTKISVVHRGVHHCMDVPRAQSIMEIKSELEEKFHIPAELIDLGYNNQRLRIDELSLRHYRIPDDAVLILYKKCCICVRIGTERICNVIVNDLVTVADLKAILHAKPGVPSTLTRLQFPMGCDLDDTRFLWHYGIGEESELYLV